MKPQIKNILIPERTCCSNATTQKQILQQISEIISKTVSVYTVHEILIKLTDRERLGSTGIGHGIALPHIRLPYCTQTIGVFMKTNTPIPFHAPDDTPVDLFFALAVPEHATSEHLQLLAQLAQTFHDPEFCEILRGSNEPLDLYEVMIHHHEQHSLPV